MRIKNGGVELGILEFIEREGVELSESDKKRKDYLDSLPKGVDVFLDSNGMQITKDEYVKNLTKNITINK